jgi:hypothetical protein
MSDDHLNSNRIRQMAALRRSAIRTRSYCVVALCGCIVGSAEFVFDAVRRWPVPVNLKGIVVAGLYFASAIGLLLLAGYFFRLSRQYHREARQTAMPPPAGSPDFSQLQDGSQVVKNLEEM